MRNGGRQKGTPNKDSAPLEDKAKELGIDPFTVLLLFAGGQYQSLGYEEPIDQATRMKAASDACKYLYAQKKAVEFSNPGDSTFKLELVDYRANSPTAKAK